MTTYVMTMRELMRDVWAEGERPPDRATPPIDFDGLAEAIGEAVGKAMRRGLGAETSVDMGEAPASAATCRVRFYPCEAGSCPEASSCPDARSCPCTFLSWPPTGTTYAADAIYFGLPSSPVRLRPAGLPPPVTTLFDTS